MQVLGASKIKLQLGKIMRLTLLIVIAFALLCSCGNRDTFKVSSDTIIVSKQADTTKLKSPRQLLIEELKRLQVAFASKDKQIIADIFPFPLADTAFGIYLDDSSYLQRFRKNGDNTTREMFINYFR